MYNKHKLKSYIFFLLLFHFSLTSSVSNMSRITFRIKDHREVYEISKLGISIEQLKNDWVVARVNKEQKTLLEEYGYKILKYYEPEVKTNGYYSYYDMVAKLDSIVNFYPDITKKFSIGKSVNGRELWVLKISDNPELDEAEPEVRFIGIIHGNEPIGCELLLNISDTLTSSYGNDMNLTDLVDNREIFIIPMINPDGRESGSRYNANGEDLNRDFPVPDSSIGDDNNWEYEVETTSLINWSDTMNFVLSTTFHSGARVVNYQWDYTHDIPPFHSLIREISKGYAIRNDSMFHSPDPYYADSGVIRGSEWYIVYGSLQDWSYHYTDCIDLTAELDSKKWPDAEKLPELWRQNKNSILYLIEKAKTGVNGIITDGETGEPVYATISVNGYDKSIKNDPIVGDYYRMLQTGTYDIQFSAPSYCSLTVYDFWVYGDSTQILNIELTPAGTTYMEDPSVLSIEITSEIVSKFYTVNLSIPKTNLYTLSIYDLLGRKIKDIFKNRLYNIGYHDVGILNNSPLIEGPYFLMLKSKDNDAVSRKILFFDYQ